MSKNDCQLKQLFALSGSAGVKAAHKLVDEIDPTSASRRTNILITNSGMFGAGKSVFGLHHENCHQNKMDRFVNPFSLVAALQNGAFYR